MDVRQAIKTLEQATANCTKGDRHIVVLDRGWIFAGDMSYDEATKVYTLTNCLNIRKWETGGFGLLSQSASKAKATLDKSDPIRFRSSAMIFAVPIGSDWDA